MAQRAAPNILFNIMIAPFMGSPVMDELRSQGQERCYDRRPILGYSSYDLDNDLDHSIKHRTGSAEWLVSVMLSLMLVLICMMACACLHVQELAKLVGYLCPTSRGSQEKIYTYPSEEWYSESPPRKSISPATKKQLEADIDALSSHSSDPDSYVCNPI